MWKYMLHCDGCDIPIADENIEDLDELEISARLQKWTFNKSDRYPSWFCPRCQLARIKGVPKLPLTVEAR